MTSLGAAWYELDARDEKLRAALDRAERDLKDTGDEGKKAGQQIDRAMDGAAGSTRGLGDAAHSAGGFLRQAAATAAGFVIAQASIHLVSRGWETLKGAVFGMNAELETSTLQFQTLMGDADLAEAHVKSLFEFAKRTPFETGPIITASKHLQVFGGAALNTEANLTLVGDAAAAMSVNMDEVAFWVGRAYNAIQAGKPFGESAMRLQEMGILTAEARQEMEEMQAAGADTSEVWGVMNRDLGRLTGAMELQAGTWSGLTSTFSDTLNMLIANAFEPFFEFAKEGLEGLNTMLGSEGVQSAIRGFGETAVEWFSQAIDVIRNVAGAVSDWVAANGPLLEALREFAGGLLQAVFDLFSALWGMLGNLVTTANDVATAIGPLVGHLAAIAAEWLVEGIKSVTEGLKALGSNDVALALGVATAAVLGVVAALSLLAAHPVIAAAVLIVAALGAIQVAGKDLADDMVGNADSLGFDVVRIGLGFSDMAAGILYSLAAVVENVQAFAVNMNGMLLGVVAGMLDFAAGVADAMALLDPSFSGVADDLRTMADAARDESARAQEELDALGGSNPLRVLADDITRNNQLIRDQFDAMQDKARETSVVGVGLIGDMVDGINRTLSPLPGQMGTFATQSGANFESGIRSATGPVTQAAAGVGAGALAAIAQGDWHGAGASVGVAFGNGVGSAAVHAANKAKSVAGAVAGVFGKSLPTAGPLQHPDRGGRSIGESWITGLQDVVRAGVPHLNATLGAFAAMSPMQPAVDAVRLGGLTPGGSGGGGTTVSYGSVGPIQIILPPGWRGSEGDVSDLSQRLATRLRLRMVG